MKREAMRKLFETVSVLQHIYLPSINNIKWIINTTCFLAIKKINEKKNVDSLKETELIGINFHYNLALIKSKF